MMDMTAAFCRILREVGRRMEPWCQKVSPLFFKSMLNMLKISVKVGLESYQEMGRLFQLLAAMELSLCLSSVTMANHLARNLGFYKCEFGLIGSIRM
jgi:hypothetical protein